jgi:LmbE family N-acetylglucosaminyl deacetylase
MPSKMRLYHPEQLAEGVAGLANVQRVFFFSPGMPTIFVDVTDVYDKKIASAVAHRSQFPKGEENLSWLRDLDTAAAKRAGLDGKLVEQFAAMRVW